MDGYDKDLDRLLDGLKATPSDRALDALEPRVWQRVAAHTARSGGTGQLQWRAAAVGFALSLGAAFGGAASARSGEPEISVFSTNSALAPSTILEGRL